MIRSYTSVLACALMLSMAQFASADFQLANPGAPVSAEYFNPPIGGPETVNYQYDDGTVEDGVGLGVGTPLYDLIWLNQFAVQPGGELITHISSAFGSPNDTVNYDGLPVSILLYNDPDGGSATNATLVQTFNTTITNGNTGILNTYDIPDTVVSNQFLVGALVRNLVGGSGFTASLDTTAPSTSGVSLIGFTAGAPLNENNLASMGANFGAIEALTAGGIVGNWAVRATGEMVPEPTTITGLFALMGLLLARRIR